MPLYRLQTHPPGLPDLCQEWWMLWRKWEQPKLLHEPEERPHRYSLTIFIQPRGVHAPGSYPGTHLPPELLRLKDVPPKQLRFEGERVTWIQASTLKELLDLKAQHPEAKLVVGNTEIGIEMKFKNQLFPMIICPAWIPELNAVEHGPEGISFGAACALSSVEKTLLEAVAKLPTQKTEVFRGVLSSCAGSLGSRSSLWRPLEGTSSQPAPSLTSTLCSWPVGPS